MSFGANSELQGEVTRGPGLGMIPERLTSEPFSKQVADLLTKAGSPQVFSTLCNKLSMLDVYSPA